MVAGFVELQAKRRGANIVPADGAGNGDTLEAELMRAIINAFAQYERGLIRARTRGALRAKRERGELTGKAPYGMRVGAHGTTLEKDPDEQKVIRRIATLRRQGQSIRAVVAKLEAEGVTSRTGKPLSKGTVENILKRQTAN